MKPLNINTAVHIYKILLTMQVYTRAIHTKKPDMQLPPYEAGAVMVCNEIIKEFNCKHEWNFLLSTFVGWLYKRVFENGYIYEEEVIDAFLKTDADWYNLITPWLYQYRSKHK